LLRKQPSINSKSMKESNNKIYYPPLEKRENVLIEANDPIIIFLKCIIFFLIISIFLVLILLVYYIRNAL